MSFLLFFWGGTVGGCLALVLFVYGTGRWVDTAENAGWTGNQSSRILAVQTSLAYLAVAVAIVGVSIAMAASLHLIAIVAVPYATIMSLKTVTPLWRRAFSL